MLPPKMTKQEAIEQGLRYFFNGKPCPQGHITKRRVAKGDCAECARLASLVWTSKNRQRKHAVAAQYRDINRIEINAWHLKHRAVLKTAAMAAYGGKCACCGETEIGFLTIDHVNGGGAKHRREIKNHIYGWLKKHNYPPGFRVLCWNCNCAIGALGVCPHRRDA